ncbi:hypothetical protein JCM33774_79420 [Actinophytocola sp. KF-1]
MSFGSREKDEGRARIIPRAAGEYAVFGRPGPTRAIDPDAFSQSEETFDGRRQWQYHHAQQREIPRPRPTMIMYSSTFGGFSRSCESAYDVSDQHVAMSFPGPVGDG